MIWAYYHPGFAVDLGTHIMPIRKFQQVAEVVKTWDFVKIATPVCLEESDLLRVHDPCYVQAVKSGHPKALAESQKFPWSAELYTSVCWTNGGVYSAALRALEAGVGASLSSGFHHAHARRGEGFCTFNGLVIAVDKLRTENRLRTAAVLDMDLHYGNGTALLCSDRPYLTQLSIYGNDYWDNTPYRDVSVLRHQDGENHFSVSLPAGCDRTTLIKIMQEHLPRLLCRTKPDLLLYQAGADPLFMDPYSPLSLTHDDLLERDRIVFDFARRHRIPVAWVLAGGYTPDLSQVVRVHTNTFQAAIDVFPELRQQDRVGYPNPD